MPWRGAVHPCQSPPLTEPYHSAAWRSWQLMARKKVKSGVRPSGGRGEGGDGSIGSHSSTSVGVVLLPEAFPDVGCRVSAATLECFGAARARQRAGVVECSIRFSVSTPSFHTHTTDDGLAGEWMLLCATQPAEYGVWGCEHEFLLPFCMFLPYALYISPGPTHQPTLLRSIVRHWTITCLINNIFPPYT